MAQKRERADGRSPAADERALKRKAKIVHEKLLATYGEPQWTRLDGVSELVATILSQNTNDG
ncbi:MAG: hypothetical protein RMN52_00245, partial [Anaerolineae bacterium]|nr:hypothetical protein [Candidatus Roseilinea sp.]MDW8448406.1 hypothetical protein [Anaerolineae bacterium]